MHIAKKRKLDPMQVAPTPGAASTGIPVSIMSGDAQWAKKKSMKFRSKVPLKKQVSLGHNTVEYIWHAATPYHAKYGAIPLISAVDQPDTFNAKTTSANHLLPCHLYDLTCAPNFIRYGAADGTTLGGPQAIVNPNVMYQVGMTSGIASNTDPATDPLSWVPWKIQLDPSGSGVAGFNSTIYSQQPDGKTGANKWYLKYMKKPYSALVPTAYDTVPIGTKVQDNASLPVQVVTPPVGRKPIHVSTDVKMCLVGCSNEAVTYDISLVRFKDDIVVPTQSWYTTGTTAAPAVTTFTSGQGQTDANLQNNSAVAFWQAFCLPFTHGPGAQGDPTLVNKYCQVLGKKVVTIQPKTTIDGDQESFNHTYVSLKFRWNQTRSYGWRKDADMEFNPAVPYMTAGGGRGLGFTTNVADVGNITTSPSPRSRLFLVVRCRQAMQYGVGNLTAGGNTSTLFGDTLHNGAFTTVDITKIPSYDISIVNKFIPDLSVG